MFYIGICNLDHSTYFALENFVSSYTAQRNIQLTVKIWHTGESLCNYLKENNPLDLIFLDTDQTKINGIAIGNYIRNKLNNYILSIVIISSNKIVDPNLLKLQPLDLLIKPILFHQIEEVLDKIVFLMEKENLFFEFLNGKTLYRIMYKEIEFLYSENRKVFIVTQQNNFQFYGKLKQLLDILPYNFLLVHQSYIVNQNFIREYSYDTIKMYNNIVIPISQSKRKLVKEKITFYHSHTKK